MSVMPETSQLAMGPYVASAEATSALYAWTAVSREALVVKMLSSRRRWWVGGTPLPMVAAPVPRTAAAPRRMRMRKFTARSAAWWLMGHIQWLRHAGRADEESEGVVLEEGD